MNLNRKLVTKEGLMKKVSDVDVFRYYIGKEINLNSSISSPLRKDSNPSFGFFRGNSGEICFKDFVLGSGDCIKFVELLFGLSFFDAMSKIVVDFSLTNDFECRLEVPTTKNQYDNRDYKTRQEILDSEQETKLGKKSRPWEAHDFAYWYRHGIDPETLKKYQVEPIEYLFINNKPYYMSKYAYIYKEYKDGEETFKMYQPFNKDFKWLTNHDGSTWQGWEQLPVAGNYLIITKSLKDVMALNNLTRYDAVALQAESVKPKEHVIKELKDRFAAIFVLYDNDFDKEVNWGRQLGNAFCKEHDLVQIEIPDQWKSKDFSDLVKNHGRETAVKILEKLLEIPF